MIPKYEEIMSPLLKLLGDGNEHPLRECIDKLSQEFQLTDEEKRERLESGSPKFDNRVGWARTYLLKAGLIESPRRGYMKITERGKEVLKESPEKIDDEYLMRFEEFIKFKKSSQNFPKTKHEKAETPEEIIENHLKILKNHLKDQLMEKIQQASAQFFERLVIDVIVKMGYGSSFEEVAQHIGRSGDEGYDYLLNSG